MSLTVCQDPGLRQTGISVFRDTTLVLAFLARNPEKKARGLPAWMPLAKEVEARLKKELGVSELIVDQFVGEEMPVYAWDGLQKRRDLLQCQGVMGTTAARVGAVKYVSYEPFAWKSNVPKDVMCARIEGRLTEGEVAAIAPCPASLRHNVIDAVGIGLFHLGRL